MRRDLEQCAIERRNIDRERQTLLEAAQIYDRELQSGVPVRALFEGVAIIPPETRTVSAPETDKPLRARIGPQRYRMLHALRERGSPVSTQELALITGLGPRRVKDQMMDDCAIGVVISETGPADTSHRITEIGLDLLERFEAYKRTRGQALPSLIGPLRDDGHDDVDPEEAGAEETEE